MQWSYKHLIDIVGEKFIKFPGNNGMINEKLILLFPLLVIDYI